MIFYGLLSYRDTTFVAPTGESSDATWLRAAPLESLVISPEGLRREFMQNPPVPGEPSSCVSCFILFHCLSFSEWASFEPDAGAGGCFLAAAKYATARV